MPIAYYFLSRKLNFNKVKLFRYTLYRFSMIFLIFFIYYERFNDLKTKFKLNFAVAVNF